MRRFFSMISLLLLLASCGPAVAGFAVLYQSTKTTTRFDETASATCDTPLAAYNDSLFTQRVLSSFSPPITCHGRVLGTTANGQAYGAISMTFPHARLVHDIDEFGSVALFVNIEPEAALDRDWFVEYRADFANGYDADIDWDTDTDDDPLIERYWEPNLMDTEVIVTFRDDGSIAQVWFSDLN